MCGICGVFNYRNGAPVSHPHLVRMNDSLRHRGPDEDGIYESTEVGLGIRRLKIIDLSTGSQPIYNEDKSKVIVFNGEIFNYLELKAGLVERGHVFSTRSDTEVIIHLYEEYGEKCVLQLNGMFAFAIWDAQKKALFVARDHLGIKPLYYYDGPGWLAFASELKSLVARDDVPKEIDRQALEKYFALRYIPAPLSIYRGIKKLPAGCYLVCNEEGFRIERYWDLAFPNRNEGLPKSELEYTENVRSLLKDAVRMQLVSDVPLGAFLSGGIDSSAIVGLMAEELSTPVKTFSVGFKGWKSYDELKYAKIVAEHFGTDHNEIMVEARAGDLLPEVVRYFDEPMADPAAIPTYLMSKVAREQVTVTLTGEGADELFAGYGWYGWAQRGRLNRMADVLPRPARRTALGAISRLMDGKRGKRTLMSALIDNFEEQYFETIACSVFQRAERRALFSRELRQELGAREYWQDFDYFLDRSADYHPQDRMQYLDTKIWLADDPLTKVDRMSMAVSLEARVPFLDYRLVELAAQIPPEMKRKERVSKYILRESLKDLIPAEILAREKHAFDVPVAEWLRNDLRGMLVSLNEHSAITDSGLFNVEFVRKLASFHLSGKKDYSRELWTLLNFAEWYTVCFCNGS